MSDETVEITNEDNIMFLQLAASLTPSTFRDELDGTELIHALDIIHEMGADVCIMWGTSLYINMEGYFNRVSIESGQLADAMFQAIHDFSLWYLKQRKNEPTN